MVKMLCSSPWVCRPRASVQPKNRPSDGIVEDGVETSNVLEVEESAGAIITSESEAPKTFSMPYRCRAFGVQSNGNVLWDWWNTYYLSEGRRYTHC